MVKTRGEFIEAFKNALGDIGQIRYTISNWLDYGWGFSSFTFHFPDVYIPTLWIPGPRRWGAPPTVSHVLGGLRVWVVCWSFQNWRAHWETFYKHQHFTYIFHFTNTYLPAKNTLILSFTSLSLATPETDQTQKNGSPPSPQHLFLAALQDESAGDGSIFSVTLMQVWETHRWDGQTPIFFGNLQCPNATTLYPFQSSMDAQRILCKRFQLVGFQSTGQNRNISALSRFSIAKKRNWTLGRFFFGRTSPNKIQQSYQRLLRPSGTCENFAGRCCGKGWCPRWTESWEIDGRRWVFLFFVKRLFHPTGPYPGIRIPIHPHQISEWILTQWWYNGITCIFCSHQMDLRQRHPPLWSSQATEKYAQVAWLKH